MTQGKRNPENNISKEQWVRHFKNLFESLDMDDNILLQDDHFEMDENLDNLENYIFNSEILEEEILRSIKSLKKGTSGGEDKLIPEFFIYSVDKILPLLIVLFNRLFETGEFPDAWNKANIVVLHKKGDTNDPNNYR